MVPKDYDQLEVPASRYYIYFLYIPGRPSPIYVGKGSGRRFKTYAYDSCINDLRNNMLKSKLSQLKRDGLKYKVMIVFETDDEEEAFDVESFYIQFYGRRSDSSGILYNLDCFGASNSSSETAKQLCKPIYWRGFIFPSIQVAVDKLKRGRTSFGRDKRRGLAFEVSDVEAKGSEGLGDPMLKFSMKGRFNSTSRKVEIDGVTYESLKNAADCFGYPTSATMRYFLESGNHRHSYKIFGKDRALGRGSPIIINGSYYRSWNSAAKDIGFSTGSALKRHIYNTDHEYKVEFLTNKED